MLGYNYDAETGEYLGKQDLRPLPLREGLPNSDRTKWSIPANCTLEKPPSLAAGRVACFQDGAWYEAEDHRGKEIYSVETKQASKITTVGSIPDDQTAIKPPSARSQWDGKAWVEPPYNITELADYAAAKRWELERGDLTMSSGMQVKTDEQSQNRITMLAVSVIAEAIDLPVNFKAVNGWYSLSGDDVLQLHAAVTAKIEQSYNIEAEIAKAKPTSPAEIDEIIAKMKRT
jgi:hypothetical protein